MDSNGFSAIVDLDRYPIADLARPEARAVIDNCRRQVADNGRNALHRVSPVQGDRSRIMALFSYVAEPGYVFGYDIHRRFFGRAR